MFIQHNKHQKGVALITVLVISAILVVYATFILNDKMILDRRTSNIISASRAEQYMSGAETFGVSLLQQYFEQSKAKRVTRTQPWATTPMQFPIESDRGKLEGYVKDMHSCFNLNSILMPSSASSDSSGKKPANESTEPDDIRLQQDNGARTVNKKNSAEAQAEFGKKLPGEKLFIKLIEPLLPESEATASMLAATLRDWVDADQETSSADGAEDYEYTGYQIPYRTGDTFLGHSSELLTIKGFTPEIYDAIKDYICVLPTNEGTINVNTVKPEHAILVWFLLKDADLSAVKQVLSDMPEEGYSESDFFAALGKGEVAPDAQGRLVFDSKYLLMSARAQIGTGVAKTQSLLLKNGNKFSVVARHIGE